MDLDLSSLRINFFCRNQAQQKRMCMQRLIFIRTRPIMEAAKFVRKV